MSDETMSILIAQSLEFEAERQASFAVTDPDTCKHGMVYNKQGDDMHCNSCDKFMYDLSKD